MAGAGHAPGPGPWGRGCEDVAVPKPGTLSCLFRVGKTSQGGNETLWESNLQSQITALLVSAQGLGLTVSDTAPGLQGRGLRQGTLPRVGDRDWGHPAAQRGWAAPSIPGDAGISVPALTNPSPSPHVRTRGKARTSRDSSVNPSRLQSSSAQGGGRQQWRRSATSMIVPLTAGPFGRLELGVPGRERQAMSPLLRPEPAAAGLAPR